MAWFSKKQIYRCIILQMFKQKVSKNNRISKIYSHVLLTVTEWTNTRIWDLVNLEKQSTLISFSFKLFFSTRWKEAPQITKEKGHAAMHWISKWFVVAAKSEIETKFQSHLFTHIWLLITRNQYANTSCIVTQWKTISSMLWRTKIVDCLTPWLTTETARHIK